MFNRNSSVQQYWETKLNINYNNEFEEYKKLCGYKYKEKLIKSTYIKGSELIFCHQWKEHIESMIDKLNICELYDYSRFFNQKSRD